MKKLMKDIHQNAIKYLTYLILNKRKLETTNHLSPHPNKTVTSDSAEPTSPKEA
jgi:hypothetical protein